MYVPPQLDHILIQAEQIRKRIEVLGDTITRDYTSSEAPLTCVVVLRGSILFAADLLRQLALPVRLVTIRASSYGAGTSSSGQVTVTPSEPVDFSHSPVLLIDDILDTGRTLQHLRQWAVEHHADSVKSCILLDKPSRREIPVKADYVGFTVPDAFVIGYGLDLNEEFRNLPYIGVLKPEFIP
ncbi:MAG TPA: hypoxanthine phosphoribosyltransferase [Verrucomicrobia bacterium]|jgi:hypoxanthine phosphoribosyltransferase|nr:hypoxanthine phosphoribosyltransferase [Verrucomicrobiota bacterium]